MTRFASICVFALCFSLSVLPLTLTIGAEPKANKPESNKPESEAPSLDEPWDMLQAKPEIVEAWQDMRFGMFNCWGPVSLTGLEIGWSRGAPRGGEFRVREGQGPTPVEIYDNLHKQWRPDRFDPKAWVQTAKDAGMKYMIFLVKHHGGFCLYDSKLTDHKITGPGSAWKVDVMREVADACHEGDLKLIIYYSQPDWHHPDYRTKNHARYIEYLHGQVRELLTNYGRIDGFWFDLGGKPEDWDTEKLFKMMRTLQPWLIINNRCGLPGDFDTPEQRLGAFQLDRPWETCMTLGTQWAWKPDDRIKSLKECIDVLVTCAGRNGNLALNTGPMPDGQIEPRQVERFRQIGQWLDEYGQTIYGTRGGPFWGLGCVSTRTGNTVYLHVLDWHDDRVLLPPVATKKIVSHSVLTGGEAVLTETDEGLEITIPPEHRHALDTIIVLNLDRPAAELEPIAILSGSLTFGKQVTASHCYDANPKSANRYRPEHAVDGDPQSGWTFNPDVPSAWIEVDLGESYTFDHAWLNEPHDRIRKFELQAKHQDQWQTFHQGTTLGENFAIEFEPVTAQHVRLHVLETTINPLVGEFQLFRPRQSSKR